MNWACLFLIAISVFVSTHAHAIRIGDRIVRQVSCRSGATVDDLNTAKPGLNFSVRQQPDFPDYFVVDIVTTGYRESRTPCPVGDQLEIFVVKVDQLDCSSNTERDLLATELIFDIDLKDIEIHPDGGATVRVVPQDTSVDGRHACPPGDQLLIRLSPIGRHP